MKRISIVIVALLLVSMVAYGDACGWTDDGTIVRLTTSTDNVGIGTTSPGTGVKLGINGGNFKILGNYKITSGGDSLRIEGNPNGYTPAALKLEQGNITKPKAYLYGGGNPGGEGYVILAHTGSAARGYVGIRKTNPSCELDVAGTIQMTGFKLTTGATNGYVLTSNSSGVGTWQLQWLKSGSDIYYSSGEVGIGITNPGYPLDVNGTIQTTGFKLTTGATNGYVLTSNSSGVGTWQSIPLQWSVSGSDIYYTAGEVGIGKTNPGYPLDINGTIQTTGFKLTTGAASSYVLTSDGSGVGTWQSVPLQWAKNGNDIYYNTGNVGVGIIPSEKLHVNGTVRMSGFKLTTGATNGYVLTSDGSGTGTWQSIPLQWSESDGDIYYNTGNVCIGTDTPQSELTVNGTITTKEMKVKLTGWPDFVFADNHKLMPLNKLERHIKKEKNLPGIPTGKNVAEEGVYVGEMQAKLLEKVEELTLYVIELNKEVGELRKENIELRKKISAVSK